MYHRRRRVSSCVVRLRANKIASLGACHRKSERFDISPLLFRTQLSAQHKIGFSGYRSGSDRFRRSCSTMIMLHSTGMKVLKVPRPTPPKLYVNTAGAV